MHDEIIDAYRALAADERFSDKYMELVRDPDQTEGLDHQVRVATEGDLDVVAALEQFAAARGLYSSTMEIGPMVGGQSGRKVVMMIKRV